MIIVPNRVRGLCLAACVAASLAPLCAWAEGESAMPERQGVNAALPNPSFEEKDGARVAEWSVRTWGGKARFEQAEEAQSGDCSVRVSSKAGADAGWVAEAVVQPYSVYRFEGWIKTEDVEVSTGKGALFNVYATGSGATQALTGTTDWTRVERLIETGPHDTLQVHCLLGAWGLATGTAWFDNLSLERVSTTELHPAATIDVGETRPPISKYIYGQFIEHLGRCIYGGIWAEMLEDRKFYYDVGSEKSPWRVFLGSRNPMKQGFKLPGVVRMAAQDVFVGDHTPEIRVREAGKPFGIIQSGLALRKDKEYVVRIVLSGQPNAEPLDVILVSGPGKDERQAVRIGELVPQYTTLDFRLKAMADTNDGSLQIVGYGAGAFRVGCVSLMPEDHVEGMRPDTLALLKELDAPVYRWPGGNFVSGYDWRDGIGDPDRRPPRKNPAWKGVEHNDFGLNEFMTFCRILDTEPYIAVNSGLGEVGEAVAQLQYANASTDTEMGRVRAEHGHAEPYGVKWWGIGNEMYGNWQLGHMPLADYVNKHNEFARAMRAEDASISLVGVGATGEWSETMLAHCAGYMDLLSEHFYCGEKAGLLSHVRQIPDSVRAKADAHRKYLAEIPALKDKRIPIALDEWNYWYGPYVYGELGTRYFLKDALGIAAGLHEMARNSDIFFMANYAQTVNVIGAIKTTKSDAAFATTGLVLKLYRKHLGTIPVGLEGDTAPLDVVAAWREDRTALTVAIVNPTTIAQTLTLDVKGVELPGTGRLWTIRGADPMDYNEPGVEPKVQIVETPVSGQGDTLEIPPLAICLYALDV